MTENSTFNRLAAIIIKNFEIGAEKLTPTATLDELGIDSMSTIDLLFNVEDEFGITIGREPLELRSLQDVVDYIERLILEQQVPRLQAQQLE